MIRAILFDAAGTLFYLTKTVGDHYAYVGREVGLDLDAQKLESAFHAAWQQMPRRPAIDGPRKNDDKGWWRELVGHVFDQVAPSVNELDRDNFFEVAYEHFAEAGVWELYPEVPEVLEQLRPRFQLAVISNFDGRLRFILQHLGISKLFQPHLHFQRTRRGQTGSGNFSARIKDNASECERGPSRRRRSRTRLESSGGGWLVSFSVGSAKKFAARFA